MLIFYLCPISCKACFFFDGLSHPLCFFPWKELCFQLSSPFGLSVSIPLDVFIALSSNTDGGKSRVILPSVSDLMFVGAEWRGEPKGAVAWVPENHPSMHHPSWRFQWGSREETWLSKVYQSSQTFDAPNQNLCCQDFTPEDSCIYVDSGTTDGLKAR